MIVWPSRGSRRISVSYIGALRADVGDRARLVDVEVGGRVEDAVAQGAAPLGGRISGLELEVLRVRAGAEEGGGDARGGAGHAECLQERATADEVPDRPWHSPPLGSPLRVDCSPDRGDGSTEHNTARPVPGKTLSARLDANSRSSRQLSRRTIRMEFGVLFTSHPNHATEPYPHRDVHARTTAEIQAAERLGYDTAWIAEHHFANQLRHHAGLSSPTWPISRPRPRASTSAPRS